MFFDRPRFSLVMFLVFSATSSEEKFSLCISCETVITVSGLQSLPLCFNLGSNKISGQQEQDTTSLSPFLIPRTCLRHKKIENSCGGVRNSAYCRIRTGQRLVFCVQFVFWQTQIHTVKCSNDLVL